MAQVLNLYHAKPTNEDLVTVEAIGKYLDSFSKLAGFVVWFGGGCAAMWHFFKKRNRRQFPLDESQTTAVQRSVFDVFAGIHLVKSRPGNDKTRTTMVILLMLPETGVALTTLEDCQVHTIQFRVDSWNEERESIQDVLARCDRLAHDVENLTHTVQTQKWQIEALTTMVDGVGGVPQTPRDQA
ncbi:unnamed protein product [Penicillium bialowiezense]